MMDILVFFYMLLSVMLLSFIDNNKVYYLFFTLNFIVFICIGITAVV